VPPAMEALQAELTAVKQMWGKQIELSKAEKGSSGFPFPVCCTRYTPQPESASMWDCEELPIRLVISSSEVKDKAVSVEVPPIFPGELSGKIEQAVEMEWRKQLGKKADKGEIWKVKHILEWVEAKFGELLRLIPDYVDNYIGCDDLGASMRRYTLVGPKADGDDDDEEEDIDEEEQEKRRLEYIEREQARLDAELEAKYKEDEEKRKLAEQGFFEDGAKTRQLSKKELAEANPTRKERSGQRWRKTGAKAHKPVREDDKALKGLPGQKKK